MSLVKNLFGESSITLRHFAIGNFTLDVVTEESHQLNITATESAVESGARITDHRIINPHELMIRGTVVNYEPKTFVEDMFPEQSVLLESINLPISISAVTDQVKHAVNQVKSVVSTVSRIGSAIGNIGFVSKNLPNVQSFFNDLSQPEDRITQYKNTLEQIAINEDFIEVMTSTGLYSNIQINAVSVVRDNYGAAEFQIYLKEILTYDVEIVGGINVKIKPVETAKKEATKVMGEKKSDRPAVQAAKAQNKGKTQPQKSKKSALKTIFDSVGIN